MKDKLLNIMAHWKFWTVVMVIAVIVILDVCSISKGVVNYCGIAENLNEDAPLQSVSTIYLTVSLELPSRLIL